MAINQFNNCGDGAAITGIACNPDIGAPVKPFLTKTDFSYATVTAANTLATVVTGITDENVFPLPMVEEFANNSEADTKYTSPINSVQRTVRRGKTVHEYKFIFNPSLHRRLQSFDGTTMRFYYGDTNDNLIFTSPDDTVVKGFEVYVNVDKWMDSDGSTPAFTPVTLTFTNNDEREAEVAVIEASYNVKALNGVQPATVTVVGTPTATATTVLITSTDTGVGISGLLPADFIFLQDSDGAEETISSAPESSTIPGQYALAGAAFETGTVNVRNVVTIGTAYYKGTAAPVTI